MKRGNFRAEARSALLALLAAGTASAQYVDPRHCTSGTIECEDARRVNAANDAAYDEQARQEQAESERQRRALLRQPPLPAEHNALLGSWRLREDQRSSVGELGREAGGDGLIGIVGMLSSLRLEKLGCEAAFSDVTTFAPSTYSGRTIGGAVGGPVTYRSGRSGDRAVLVALPDDGGMLVFEVQGPNQIVSDNGCVLVRSGAPGAGASANAANSANAAKPTSSPGKLAVGPDAGGYLCPDGRQLYVNSCFNELPDAQCGIINLHLPMRGGYQVRSSGTRAAILPTVAACTLYPVEFGNDGNVGLVLPQSAAPVQKPPTP